MLRLIISIVVIFQFCLTVGCSVQPSKINTEQGKNFISNILYVKDERTDLCFAIVASTKALEASENGIGLTAVSCEAVKDFLE